MPAVDEPVTEQVTTGLRFRSRVHDVLAGAEGSGGLGRPVAASLTVLIVLNVVAAALQTVGTLRLALWGVPSRPGPSAELPKRAVAVS